MTSYHRFIDDSRALAHYAGHRYVVLRVAGDPARCYREVQARLRLDLRDPAIMYPAEPHVTFAGYKPGTDTPRLATLVADWAATVAPLEIEVGEPVSWFPPPFQIVVLPVRRTQALFDALVAIRDAGSRAGLPLATVMPAENWTFHLTLATCTGLDSPAWAEVQQVAAACEVGSPARWVAQSAELVVFDRGDELSGGVFSLQGLTGGA